jgi:GT2 family glycosyltransferase
MRVLAHIHTFNDADIIDQTVDAVLRQTRPVDEILIVDNASTDATTDRPCMTRATLIRHDENLGTSGAVQRGFRYALEHGYDWIWIFDADSLPEPDALETLLDLYAGWPPQLQEEVACLGCLSHDERNRVFFPGAVFTQRGIARSRPTPQARHYACHFTLWSGCLYCLATIRQIGHPNPDYVLDWGEIEYGYRVMKAGFKCYIHQDAVLHHNVRGYASVVPVEIKRGGTTVTTYDYPPIRCYYSSRNRFYFALYDFTEKRIWLVLREAFGQTMLMLSFLVHPRNHGRHVLASFRGIWHGIIGNIAARY